jgi:hypothetical protein
MSLFFSSMAHLIRYIIACYLIIIIIIIEVPSSDQSAHFEPPTYTTTDNPLLLQSL